MPNPLFIISFIIPHYSEKEKKGTHKIPMVYEAIRLFGFMSEHRFLEKEGSLHFRNLFKEFQKNTGWKILFAGRNKLKTDSIHLFKNHNPPIGGWYKHKRRGPKQVKRIVLVPFFYVFHQNFYKSFDCDFYL